MVNPKKQVKVDTKPPMVKYLERVYSFVTNEYTSDRIGLSGWHDCVNTLISLIVHYNKHSWETDHVAKICSELQRLKDQYGIREHIVPKVTYKVA